MNRCSDSDIAGIARRGALALLAAALLVAAGLGAAGPARAEVPWRIVTTTAQLADLMRNVAGERAVVESLMGEGVDPHLYRATRSDVSKLMAADIVVYNGLFLEGKLGDTLGRVEGAGKPVFALAERLDPAERIAVPGASGQFDPHVWMDVRLWSRLVEAARDILSGLDPAGAGHYAERAAAHLAELQRLDGYAREVLASVPERSRVLVTAHDAFAYFGRAYGFEVVGIQGISTDSEAGLRRVEELVALIVERGIAAVFVESSVSDRNVQALVDGAAARGHAVRIGGQLYSDAMGAPGTYEGTYIGMIDHNVTTIARSLGGTAPPGGLNGRLVAAIQ